jgi:hypothetical protein
MESYEVKDEELDTVYVGRGDHPFAVRRAAR